MHFTNLSLLIDMHVNPDNLATSNKNQANRGLIAPRMARTLAALSWSARIPHQGLSLSSRRLLACTVHAIHYPCLLSFIEGPRPVPPDVNIFNAMLMRSNCQEGVLRTFMVMQ